VRFDCHGGERDALCHNSIRGHAPLQVIDGNYERMSGVCPWWDAVKRGGRPIWDRGPVLAHVGRRPLFPKERTNSGHHVQQTASLFDHLIGMGFVGCGGTSRIAPL